MKIYCAGIGGIGVSAYAMHMHARGHSILGTDRSHSSMIENLKSHGIFCSTIQDGSLLTNDIDLFVYSQAIPESSPERKKAMELGILSKSYFEAVADLTENTELLCIAGTHGKSSTTAMLAHIMIDAGKDPNVILGTYAPDMGNQNWRVGTSSYWIVEACEYRRQFLALSPKHLIITNADGDHYDAFSDHNDYLAAFHEFAQKIPPHGTISIHAGDEDMKSITDGCQATVLHSNQDVSISCGIPGEHMRQNARLAAVLAKHLGIEDDMIQKSLASYRGTWRRMELKTILDGDIRIIDDYAHHPTEITATLSAFREAYPGRRIVCAFQFHTHDRTLKLWKEFIRSLAEPDILILAPVYDARPDREREEVNQQKFANELEEYSGKKAIIASSLAHTTSLLKEMMLPGDIIITMGAGTITDVANQLCCSNEQH